MFASLLGHPLVSWQSWNFTTILHCPGPVAHLLIHQHLNNFISKLLWHFTRKSSTSLIWTTFKFPDNQLGTYKYENVSSEMSTTLTLPHLARNIAFIQTCETPPGRRYMKWNVNCVVCWMWSASFVNCVGECKT